MGPQEGGTESGLKGSPSLPGAAPVSEAGAVSLPVDIGNEFKYSFTKEISPAEREAAGGGGIRLLGSR